MTAIVTVYAPNTYRVTTARGYEIHSMDLRILKSDVARQSRHLPPGDYWMNITRLVEGAWVEV